MDKETEYKSESLLNCTAQIVSAHLTNNQLDADEISSLIHRVYSTLGELGENGAPGIQGGMMLDRPQPAVPIRKSLTPDYIICLEDGKQLKMLKRHLKATYNMTPEQYRQRWGLPHDYPMVAPNYAQKRSELAKKTGLGKNTEA